jgi:adenylate cyclase class 2
MSSRGEELEVKFYLRDREALEARLVRLGARLVQARLHEVNLRFDTPSGELSASHRVLRLRQDAEARLTYKGPGQVQDGVQARQEYEFIVSDYAMAKALFESLGYQVLLMYEKYRTTYGIGSVVVTLDEMPFGVFAEIEGPDGKSIQAFAGRLGLDWERRILDSYIALFERLRSGQGYTFRDLSFANFQGLDVSPSELGLLPADSSL